MSAELKRKGSPVLDDETESTKRRFVETEETPAVDKTTNIARANDQSADVTEAQQPQALSVDGKLPESSVDAQINDRAARFAALQARNQASRKDNLKETKTEARRKATDPHQLTSLNRKKELAQHKLLKADVEAVGEDFERKRAWDWTVEESERWDERMAEKQRKRDAVGFADYRQEAVKMYGRQVGALEKHGFDERLAWYERDKKDAIEQSVRSGGLEIVETSDGELIAVDRDGSFYSTADSISSFTNKPNKAAVDRLVDDIRKAEETRLKKRRDRGRQDDGEPDVTYINEKNKQFNLKLARFYNKYTADIRDSFERGTAI